MGALQYVHVPRYSALLLRKEFARLNLSGGLIPRSHEWFAPYPDEVRWNGEAKRWTFLKTGATISFGHLETPEVMYRYGSSEFQYIGWDEVTDLTEDPYLFLFSRLRKTRDMAVPLRMRAASNPGNVGHFWVKNRFITDEAMAALRDGHGGIFYKGDRAFVPGRLADNPFIDREQYILSLSELSPIMRARLLNGDWGVVEGSLVDGGWFRYWRPSGDYYFVADPTTGKCLMTIDPRECTRFVTIDTAGSSKDVGREKRGKAKSFSVASVWDFHRRDGWLVLRDRWRERCDINQLCAAVDRIDQEHHPEWFGVEDATLGPSLVHLMGRLPFQLLSHEGKDKLTRFSTAMNLLEQGKVFFPQLAPWLPVWESELLAWTGHEDDPFDQGDTLGYAAKYARRSMIGTAVVPSRGAFVMGRG